MKAAFFMQHGGPEVIQYGEVANPVLAPGQVMVDIHFASVNGADWKVRHGTYAPITQFPYIMGRDFSGVVSALGAGVTDWRIGDEVFGVCDVGQEGAYAEKIAIRSDIIARKPAALRHDQCAAVALIGLTALTAIEDCLALKANETILIQGGAGGVASFAVQLAKHLGAKVISTASASNLPYLKSLGADQVIDYNAQDFTTAISGIDAVFDTVGGDVAKNAFTVLRPGGRAAFIASGNTGPTPPDGKHSLRPNVGRSRKALERIVDLIQKGAVTLPEMKVFALSDAVQAHQISQGRHFRGKLVFKVR